MAQPSEPVAERPAGALPIGVNLATIGTDPGWWLASARRLEAAGYQGVWCWDHFMGRSGQAARTVEAWTALSVAAGTTRSVELGPFVLNVMNRHPAVVAGMAATLQRLSGGRLVLGMGIGGGLEEHAALGMPLPAPAERVERLREAVAVIRALWTGEVVSRPSPFYPLEAAAGTPPGTLPPILVGGETRSGARLAAEIGDGWTAFTRTFRTHLPLYLEALEATGKDRSGQRLVIATEGGVFTDPDEPEALVPWVEDPRGTWEMWHEAGADSAIVTAADDADVDRLVAAVDRW